MHATVHISQESDSERPTNVVSKKHRIDTHFPTTEIAKSAREPRLQGLLAKGELGIQYFEQETLAT